MKKYFILLALVLVTLASCDKDEPGETPKKEYDVYLTGSTQDNTAAYWKNGVKIKLPTTDIHGSSESVFVSNGDVYITGDETKDAVLRLSRAVYWKNGEKVTLPEDNSIVSSASASTWATGICMVGNDIYIAGGLAKDYGDDGYKEYPVYWKNGELVELTGGVSEAISICVEGNDVYVLDKMGYWKNGIRVKIPFSIESEYCYATDMQIVGSDIYIAGTESLNNDVATARYWKNGVAVTLSEDNSFTTSIFVSGGDVYVTGADKSTDYFVAYPTYWKNGVPVYLSDPGVDFANSIIVLDNNIFVSGSCNKYGYWINEKFHPIEDVFSFKGMFVVERK